MIFNIFIHGYWLLCYLILVVVVVVVAVVVVVRK